MKMTLLLAVAVAGLIASGGTANAHDAALSPKAKALADSLRKVPTTDGDRVDRSIQSGSPKGIAQAESFRKVSGSSRIDLAHGQRPAFSPKDLRYEQEFRRLNEIQVAPLK